MKKSRFFGVRHAAFLLSVLLLCLSFSAFSGADARFGSSGYDLNADGVLSVGDVSFLLDVLSGAAPDYRDEIFVSEDGGVRYYRAGVFLTGEQIIDGDRFFFDPDTGLMATAAFSTDLWAYGEPEAFVRDGLTLYRYPKPTAIEGEIHLRVFPLNYNQNNCVSTKYDPHTYTEGATTNWYLWYETDFIDVSDCYALAYNLSGHKYLQSITFYDADKSYLSGRAIRSSSDCVTLREVVVLPEGAKYVRCVNRLDGGAMDLLDSFLYGLATEADYHEYMRVHDRENKKIVLIGDSLTEGDQGSSRSGVTNKTTYNYPYYLSKTLECNVENNGHCGITVSGFFSNYGAGDVDVSDADLVLVMLGTNGGITTDSVKQSYSNLIKLIRADLKPGARVVLVTPPHATEIEGKVNYGYNENVRSAVEYALSLAVEKGYPVIDAYHDSPIKEENEDLYQPNDGLHMSKEGYRVFAEFIASKLLELGLIE